MSWNVYHDNFGFYIWGEHMKKYIFFILFLSVLFFKPITVHASYLPPALPTNTNSIVDFIVSSAITDLSQHGVRVADSDALNSINRILNGGSIFESTTSSYVDLSTSNWTIGTNLYDSNGNIVNQSDAYMALIQTDAGTATGIFDKSTGEPLLMGDSFSDAESTIISGQLATGQINRFPLTQPILTQRLENNGVFTSPTLTQEVRDEFQNYAFSGYARSTNQGFICFIPNGCSATTRILPIQGQYTMNVQFSSNPTDSYGFDFATNNPSDINFVNPNNSNYATYKTFGRYVSGKYFTYGPRWANSYNVFAGGGEIYFHAPTDAEYNALSNSQVVYTEPVNNVYEITNNYYEYTTFNDNRPTYTSTINSNYNPSSDITPSNYPRENNVYITDYSPNINYYENYITHINSPGIGENIGDVDSEGLTDNLPILNNLEKRFPFSIPFDVYNLLSGLSAERTTPYINTDIVIPGINYTWHFEYDLHAFDNLASLFRTLFLIFFIIGLAWLSYDHFFGS